MCFLEHVADGCIRGLTPRFVELALRREGRRTKSCMHPLVLGDADNDLDRLIAFTRTWKFAELSHSVV